MQQNAVKLMNAQNDAQVAFIVGTLYYNTLLTEIHVKPRKKSCKQRKIRKNQYKPRKNSCKSRTNLSR